MARKPGGRVRASPGRWALPARCLSVKEVPLCQGWLLQGWGGARKRLGPGQLEGLCFRKMAGGEEDEGMGEELEPEAWRQDRACW